MMKRSFRTLLLPLFLFYACSGDKHQPDGHLTGPDSSAIRNDSAHVFLLPAPLQVATLMRMYCADPETGILSSDSVPVSRYETNYYRALNLGICMTDIGYASFYNDRQLALNYLERAEALIKDLHLDNIRAETIRQLRDHINQPDSLSALLLSVFRQSQEQLNQGGNEKTAFYISAGCYLEGLAISLSSKKLTATKIFPQLFFQQKLWLDQQAEAITYLGNDPETQDLYNTFYTLQYYFKPAVVKERTTTMPAADLEKLRDKAVQLRNEAVKG